MKDIDTLKLEIEESRKLLDVSIKSGKKLEYSYLDNANLDVLIAAYIDSQEERNLEIC